jgi:hypothetical protein
MISEDTSAYGFCQVIGADQLRSDVPPSNFAPTHQRRGPLSPRTLLLVATLSLGTQLRAQVVRGTVTEKTSRAPIAGVLVFLERDARPLVTVLSDERGEYAIRAPGAGRYQITAKRIGVQRFTSMPFDLATGETARIDLTLDAVSYALPRVVVKGVTPCEKSADAERIASLWDEAKSALVATQVTVRDQLFRAELSRYRRSMEPRTLRVIDETRQILVGDMQQPFVSLGGDSLSKVGYWGESDNGMTVFYAPDAEALLSDAFLRDHCFIAVEPGRTGGQLVGLAFRPHRGRRAHDVQGTMWLDARAFELRSLDFGYTQLPRHAEGLGVGGQVHFARLPNGAWVVRHWFIRMPGFREDTSSNRQPMAVLELLHDEGGYTFADGVRFYQKPASIDGVMLDSAGQPFAGAAVRIGGTSIVAAVDANGRFRFDSLPAGTYTLIGEHAGYDSLGVPAGDVRATTDEGATQTVSIRAPGADYLVPRLCSGEKLKPRSATLRLTVLDGRTNRPLPGAPMRLMWRARQNEYSMDIKTDDRGVAVFCNVGTTRGMEIRYRGSRLRDELADTLSLRAGQVEARVVRVYTVPAETQLESHSARNTSAGSSLAVRRAGIQLASAAMPTNNTDVPINVTGSLGATPKSIVRRNRETSMKSTSPAPIPIPVSATP